MFNTHSQTYFAAVTNASKAQQVMPLLAKCLQAAKQLTALNGSVDLIDVFWWRTTAARPARQQLAIWLVGQPLQQGCVVLILHYEGSVMGACLPSYRHQPSLMVLHASPPCLLQTSTLRAVAEQLRWFAGPPIRNASGIGGNICTASPISGALLFWCVWQVLVCGNLAVSTC